MRRWKGRKRKKTEVVEENVGIANKIKRVQKGKTLHGAKENL
jgi:hypothetical protein